MMEYDRIWNITTLIELKLSKYNGSMGNLCECPKPSVPLKTRVLRIKFPMDDDIFNQHPRNKSSASGISESEGLDFCLSPDCQTAWSCFFPKDLQSACTVFVGKQTSPYEMTLVYPALNIYIYNVYMEHGTSLVT